MSTYQEIIELKKKIDELVADNRDLNEKYHDLKRVNYKLDDKIKGLSYKLDNPQGNITCSRSGAIIYSYTDLNNEYVETYVVREALSLYKFKITKMGTNLYKIKVVYKDNEKRRMLKEFVVDISKNTVSEVDIDYSKNEDKAQWVLVNDFD